MSQNGNNIMYEEHETRCLDSNVSLSRDIPALLLFIAIYMVLRRISKTVSKRILTKILQNESDRERMSQKFFGSAYRFVIYAVFTIYGLLSLNSESWVLKPFEYTLTWIHNITPPKIYVYYYMELAHYIASIFFLFSEPRMSDFLQMLIHHIVTIILIVFSFHTNMLRYGVLIMIVHDVSDPIMESAKLFFYSKKQKIADILFCVFAFVFISMRCLFYPFVVVLPALYYAWNYGINWQFAIQLSSLVLLLLLNLIWALFIVKMVLNFWNNGKLKGDIRTNDEGSIKED